MGVYDTLTVECVWCNVLLEEQFKPGSMREISFDNSWDSEIIETITTGNHEIVCYVCHKTTIYGYEIQPIQKFRRRKSE